MITNDAYEEFRRDSTGRTTTNPVVEPYINFDEARYFLGQKYYVARRLPSGDKTVGILWTRAGTNVFQGVIDTKLEKIISDNTGKDVSLIEPSYNSTRAIKSLPKTMSFDRMLISELNDFLAPTFYLIPSGYVEDTDMFGAFS